MALFPRRPGMTLGNEPDELPTDDEEPVDQLFNSMARSPKTLKLLGRAAALNPKGVAAQVYKNMLGIGVQGAMKPQIRNVIDPQTGRPSLQEFLPTPQGFVPGRILGETYVTPFYTPTSEGLMKVPRVPGEQPSLVPGPGGQPLRQPPSEETQQRLGSVASFRQGLGRFKETLPAFIGANQGRFGGAERTGQQVVRRIPFVGPQLSERMGTQATLPGGEQVSGEQVAAIRDRVMADFTRIMSGLQASEAEQGRLSRILPDLGTVDTQTAYAKIAEFQDAVESYVRERARLRPDLFSQGDLQELGLDNAGQPLPGRGATGRRRYIRRSRLNQLSPDEARRLESQAKAQGVPIREDL